MDIHRVLLKPTITEKSTLLQESGKYAFHIAMGAKKIEVKLNLIGSHGYMEGIFSRFLKQGAFLGDRRIEQNAVDIHLRLVLLI